MFRSNIDDHGIVQTDDKHHLLDIIVPFSNYSGVRISLSYAGYPEINVSLVAATI